MSGSAARAHVHFALSMEHAVRVSNREVMVAEMEPLTEEQLLLVSVQVAKARAAYMISAVKVGLTDGSEPSASELRILRETFEEKRDAFAALMTAIERGYVDGPGDNDDWENDT